MVYIEIARNGELSLFIKNQTDKKGIIIDTETAKQWKDVKIISTLNKVGWIPVKDSEAKEFNL